MIARVYEMMVVGQGGLGALHVRGDVQQRLRLDRRTLGLKEIFPVPRQRFARHHVREDLAGMIGHRVGAARTQQREIDAALGEDRRWHVADRGDRRRVLIEHAEIRRAVVVEKVDHERERLAFEPARRGRRQRALLGIDRAEPEVVRPDLRGSHVPVIGAPGGRWSGQFV